MDDNTITRIAAFIKKWIDAKKPKIDHFLLVHTSDKLDTLDTVQVEEGMMDPKSIAESMCEAAQTHTVALGSTQRYAVAAMVTAGTSPGKEWFCCQAPLSASGFGNEETEPPTPKGHLKMVMRQLNGAMGMAMEMLVTQQKAQEQSRKAQFEEVVALRNQQAQLSQKYLELTSLIEAAKSEQNRRDIAQVELMNAEERKAWLFGMLKQYGPVMLASMTGATKLAKFVEGLDESTRAKLMAVLPEDKQPELAEMYQLAMGAKEAQTELEGGASAPGGGNGKS